MSYRANKLVIDSWTVGRTDAHSNAGISAWGENWPRAMIRQFCRIIITLTVILHRKDYQTALG